MTNTWPVSYDALPYIRSCDLYIHHESKDGDEAVFRIKFKHVGEICAKSSGQSVFGWQD